MDVKCELKDCKSNQGGTCIRAFVVVGSSKACTSYEKNTLTASSTPDKSKKKLLG